MGLWNEMRMKIKDLGWESWEEEEEEVVDKMMRWAMDTAWAQCYHDLC